MRQMSVEQLKDGRFQSCLQKLTEIDRKRLRTPAEREPYRETAEYMLEQENKDGKITAIDKVCDPG